jgi:hypothetical protein
MQYNSLLSAHLSGVYFVATTDFKASRDLDFPVHDLAGWICGSSEEEGIMVRVLGVKKVV